MTRSTLTIPLPPSVNTAWRNVPGKGRVRTKKYHEWLNWAGNEILTQRPKAISGRVCVCMKFQHPKRRADVDNRIKPVLDLLVKHRLIDDDSDVVRLVAEWDEDGFVQGAEVSWWDAAMRLDEFLELVK